MLQKTKTIKEKYRFSRSCVKPMIVMHLVGHDLLFSMKFSNADNVKKTNGYLIGFSLCVLRKHFLILCTIKDLLKENNSKIHSDSKNKIVCFSQ